MTADRSLLVKIVAVVVVLLLGGAGGYLVWGTDEGAGDAGAGEPAADTSPVVEGGTLRIAVSGVESLDPADAHEGSAVMVADHLFDTLVVQDPETGEIRPSLAAEWEAGPDQRRFTFRLREGASFHGGGRITAGDAEATIERIAAPGSGSDLRFLLESVTGYRQFRDEEAVDDLAGVRAVDDRTLVVELDEPFAVFPAVLANPGFGVVPADRVGAPEFWEAPVGSGPMRFVERGGGVIRLERAPDRERPAKLDGVELHLVDTAEQGYELLSDGDVDVAPVPPERLGEAGERYGDAGLGPFAGVLFYGMNLEAPEFERVEMRRAVVAAVDRQRIVDVVYDGSVRLADGFVPEGIPGAADDACGERCDHDPEEARRLLSEAFPGGDVPTVAIDFDDDPVQQAVAASIRADLEEVGIPVELRPHPFQDYGIFLVRGQPELFRLGWTADYLSPDGFLYPLFVSGEGDNLANLSHERVDELLAAARAEGDRGRRAELYRQAEQLVLEQQPVVPIAQFTNRWAVAPRVAGFEMTPLGTFDVAAVSLVSGGGAGG